jgi:hypothetical protein
LHTAPRAPRRAAPHQRSAHASTTQHAHPRRDVAGCAALKHDHRALAHSRAAAAAALLAAAAAAARSRSVAVAAKRAGIAAAAAAAAAARDRDCRQA